MQPGSLQIPGAPTQEEQVSLHKHTEFDIVLLLHWVVTAPPLLFDRVEGYLPFEAENDVFILAVAEGQS